jgi:hypothetical protein
MDPTVLVKDVCESIRQVVVVMRVSTARTRVCSANARPPGELTLKHVCLGRCAHRRRRREEEEEELLSPSQERQLFSSSDIFHGITCGTTVLD